MTSRRGLRTLLVCAALIGVLAPAAWAQTTAPPAVGDKARDDLYNLRWNAANETAYPSTFVFDRQGVVRFAKISKSHGDRSSAVDILALFKSMK